VLDKGIMMLNYKGQSLQDAFAYEITGNNGTYIEIGAAFPVTSSNTYALEVDKNWRGFSIELNKSHYEGYWNQCSERKNQIYWANALTFDYAEALQANDMPKHVNYLSCDIEPPFNTFLALQRVIDQGITFDCITFEHDLYCNPNPNYNHIGTEYLGSKGYKPAIINVHEGTNLHYETWFVKNSIDYDVIDFNLWVAKTLNKEIK
jgi:hypothetical protein